MLVNYVPTTRSPVPTESIEWNARLTFLNLPNEIVRMVFRNLDLPDRASLALTCKPVALKLDFCRLLEWDLVQMKRLHRREGDPVADLLKGRLGKDWFPAHLKYCCKCGNFVPRSEKYWKTTLQKEFSMKSGNVGQKYRRWTAEPGSGKWSSTTLKEQCVQWSRPKPQTCPRCRLLA